MNFHVRRLDPEIPDPVEARRSSSGALVRFVYGAAVALLLSAMAWHFGQHFVLLKGPGRVTAGRTIVSVPYNMTVKMLNVRVGSAVSDGDVIGQIISFDVEKHLADLHHTIAEQVSKENDLRIRFASARAGLDSARKRLLVANENVRRLEAIAGQIASTLFRIEIYRESAIAELAVAQMNAESSELAGSIERTQLQLRLLQEHLAKVEREFNNGLLTAPIAGIVGPRLAKTGETVTVGGIVAEIYDTNDIYVEWPIPEWRLIEPKIGDAVFIFNGARMLSGKIEEILPLAVSLETSGRSMLREKPRGQMARVSTIGSLHGLNNVGSLESNVSVQLNYLPIGDLFGRMVCTIVGCT